MKTDDYKQELRISATLCQTNAKKIFLRSKITKPPQNPFVVFESCCREITDLSRC